MVVSFSTSPGKSDFLLGAFCDDHIGVVETFGTVARLCRTQSARASLLPSSAFIPDEEALRAFMSPARRQPAARKTIRVNLGIGIGAAITLMKLP